MLRESQSRRRTPGYEHCKIEVEDRKLVDRIVLFVAGAANRVLERSWGAECFGRYLLSVRAFKQREFNSGISQLSLYTASFREHTMA